MGDGTGVLFGSFSASSSEEKGHHKKTLSKGAPFARFKTQKAIKRDAHFGSAANPADAHDLSLSIYGRWNGCPFWIVFCIFKGEGRAPPKKEK